MLQIVGENSDIELSDEEDENAEAEESENTDDEVQTGQTETGENNHPHLVVVSSGPRVQCTPCHCILNIYHY